jgi:prepilin-type N-terminal cleavage/methylation domain-containing protein
MRKNSRQKGFILIELVMTLVLIGILGAFAGLLLYTGASGFLTSKKISETALKAQAVMDRMSIELRNIKVESTRPVLTSTSIVYQSDDTKLPGTRTISYNSATSTINLSVDGTSNVLLDQVQDDSFALTWIERDLNNSIADGNELSEIKINFKVKDVGTPFSVSIYPRGMVKKHS